MESRKPTDNKVILRDEKLFQAEVSEPVPTTSQDKAASAAPLKRQELIAQVVARSGVAKKHAKPVVEAVLAALADALSEGRDLNLEPMGKVKRKRVKETAKARIVIANIRQSKTEGVAVDDSGNPALSLPGSGKGPSPKEAVAEGAEGR